MIRFSTIIPTHNRADLLPASLDSALAQNPGGHEIIVVDAGSTDNTPEVLARYAGRVRVITTANHGPGAARNAGLAAAAGEYITFLDSDDLWFPWTLATLHRAIEENGQPAFVAGTHVDFFREDDPRPTAPAAYAGRCYADYLATAQDGVWIGTPAVAIRRDILQAAGGFAEGRINAEDSDLWLRLGTAPGFVHVAAPPVFAYRRHATSAISAMDRTFRGTRRLIAEEERGAYPGGAARQRERRTILSRHIRPASIACLRAGLRSEAWELFRATAGWHARLGRWKYLAAFPLVAAVTRFQPPAA